jgi:CubicO group peptidase (beta-lactamase class C family)
MRPSSHSFFLLLLSWLLTFTVYAQKSPPDSIAMFLQDRMQKLRIPGLQVAVIRQGKLVKLGSYGLASVEHAVPTTDESVFSINSMTKAFVGVAIMQLAEAGKLRLEDPLARYLPDLPSAWRSLKLHQLLSHTSGLPNILDASEHILGGGQEAAAWAQVQTLPMEFAPGEKFSYNQTGYVILGRIITQLSGRPFTQFIEQSQFKVAGLTHTRFGDSQDVVPHSAGAYTTKRNVDGHWVDQKELSTSYVEFPAFVRAGAGILSTAQDLARWLLALQDGRLLQNKTSVQALWTPAVLNNGRIGGSNDFVNGYALGWPTVTRAEHPAVAPIGGMRSALFVYPQDDLSVVVLTNLQGANPEYFIDEIGGYFLSDLKQSHGFGLSPGLKKLRAELLKRGFDKAGAVAARLRKQDTTLQLPENDLNAWGYLLLEQQQPAQALAILRLNAALYPASANTYDSLGEILELTGDRPGALKNYQRSLALNPTNTNAVAHIKALKEE